MPQIIALLVLAFGAPLAVLLMGADWRLLGWGAAIWAVSVAVKAVFGFAVDALCKQILSGLRWQAAVWGVWSAVCELGAVAVFFYLMDLSLVVDVVAFGVGAGAVEVLLVLATALGSKSGDDSVDGQDWFVEWSGVLERASTLAGHVGSRGLIWLGIQSLVLAPLLVVAIALFALVDAVAVFGVDAKWDWTDQMIARKMQAFLASVAAVELALFAVLLQL